MAVLSMRQHIIWSNEDLDYERDWKADLEAEYPELSDYERQSLMYEQNGEYLQDERMNLNIPHSQPILIIADLGLWYGRRIGYKEIESGNIKDCLYSRYDYTTWYLDEHGEFCCDDIHHDGTNHYRYRVFKDGTDEAQRQLLEEKIFLGEYTEADLNRYTQSLGKEIAQVYGWEIPTEKARCEMELER